MVLILTFLAAGSLFISAVLLFLLKADTDIRLTEAKRIGYERFYEQKSRSLPGLALSLGVIALLLSLLTLGLYALVCVKGCNVLVVREEATKEASPVKVPQPQTQFLQEGVEGGVAAAAAAAAEADGDMKDPLRKILLVNRKDKCADLHSTGVTSHALSDSRRSCPICSHHDATRHSNVLSPYEFYPATPPPSPSPSPPPPPPPPPPSGSLSPTSHCHRKAYPPLELRATKKSHRGGSHKGGSHKGGSHKGGGSHRGSHRRSHAGSHKGGSHGSHGRSQKGPSVSDMPKTHMQKTLEGSAGHNTPSAAEESYPQIRQGIPGGLSQAMVGGGGGRGGGGGGIGFSAGSVGSTSQGQAIHQVSHYMSYSVSTLIEQYDAEIARLEALLALLKKERAELINWQMTQGGRSTTGSIASSVTSARSSLHESAGRAASSSGGGGGSCVVQVQDTPAAQAPAAPTTPYQIQRGGPPSVASSRTEHTDRRSQSSAHDHGHGHAHAHAHQAAGGTAMMPVATVPMVPVPVAMQPVPVQPVYMGAGRVSHHGGGALTCACDLHYRGQGGGGAQPGQGPVHRVPLFRPKVRLGVKALDAGARPGFAENFHSIVKTELIKVAPRPTADAPTYDFQRMELINRIKSGDVIL